MEELIVYLLKSGLITVVFYGIYWCFLKNETFFRFNRHFLLAGILCAVLLPFCEYSYNINIEVHNSLNSPADQNTSGQGLSTWLAACLLIYVAGALFFMIRHITGLMRIKKMIILYGYTLLQGYKVINTPVFKSSFSVFNYIFIDISEETSELERKLIIEHELAHVKQSHWLDLMLVQLICALQWFNPFAWLYLYAVKQNNEFLADQAVLQKGNSPAVYRAALINHSLKTPVFRFASSFADSGKFKRIKMMMKTSSNPLKKLAVLIVFPALALFLFAFAKPSYTIIYQNKLTQTTKLNGNQQLTPVAEVKTDAKEVPVKTIKRSTNTTAKTSLSFAGIKTTTIAHAPADTAKHYTTMVTIDKNKLSIVENLAPGKAKTNFLMFLDGKMISSMDDVKSENIQSVNVIKNDQAVDKYGDRGKNGVIEIFSKPKPVTSQ